MAQINAVFHIQSTKHGFISGSIDVPGPQPQNDVSITVIFRVDGSLGVDPTLPAIFHVRQADFNAGIPLGPLPPGFPDQFSTQLVRYSYPVEGSDSLALVIRLRRLDQNSGWGQSLRIDALLKLKS